MRPRRSARLIRLRRMNDREHAPYCARFKTTSPVPPPDAPGVVYFSSSPLSENGRVYSTPFQFGNVLVSMRKVIVFSVSFTV